MKNVKLCLWLFCANLYVSAFTFGGGYVVVPIMRRLFVERKGLFPEDELMDMAAIAQSSPGAIAVNLAALAGMRAAGLPGAIVSCVAAVLPPLVILSIVSTAYASFRDSAAVAAVLKGMEAAVAALIVDLVIDMCRSVFGTGRLLTRLLVPVAFVAAFVFHVNVALVLLTSAMAAAAECLWRGRKEDGNTKPLAVAE